jgi:hypothetical protein
MTFRAEKRAPSGLRERYGVGALTAFIIWTGLAGAALLIRRSSGRALFQSRQKSLNCSAQGRVMAALAIDGCPSQASIA